jgi:hypothetical protein
MWHIITIRDVRRVMVASWHNLDAGDRNNPCDIRKDVDAADVFRAVQNIGAPIFSDQAARTCTRTRRRADVVSFRTQGATSVTVNNVPSGSYFVRVIAENTVGVSRLAPRATDDIHGGTLMPRYTGRVADISTSHRWLRLWVRRDGRGETTFLHASAYSGPWPAVVGQAVSRSAASSELTVTVP